MDEASIAALRADLGDEGGLWPEHVVIAEAFDLCGTQWRVSSVSAGFSGRPIWIGLDYAACRVALEFAGVAVDRRLWSGFQIMEQAAIATLNGATR